MKQNARTAAGLLALGAAMAVPLLAACIPVKSDNEDALDKIRLSMLMATSADCLRAKAALTQLNKQGLTPAERQSSNWIERTLAIRMGDWPALQTLAKTGSTNTVTGGDPILKAYGCLRDADLNGTLEILDAQHLADLNPRDQRRIYALRARIARLKGDLPTELKYIDKMIEHLPLWPEKACQACHNESPQTQKLTYLPLKQLWIGERYVQIMQIMGAAEATRAKAAAAADGHNMLAQIRLAYALKALGKNAEAEAAFARIPYCKTEKTRLQAPHKFFAFP